MGGAQQNGGRPLGYVAGALGLSDKGFTLLRDLISQRLGNFYDDNKRDLLGDKVAELVAAHDLRSLLDYYYLLKYDADADRHWSELADHLAVPETYFWRQPEQLLALANVLAERHAAERPGSPLRIWSAACCSGEEPISIAIALAEAGWLKRIPVRITASDASQRMLERARAGVYRERAFRNMPLELWRKYFTEEQGLWRVDRSIHGLIDWARVNLMETEQVAPHCSADVIFCRNVFIYFSEDAVRSVARTFDEYMPDHGTIFLGAAESLIRLGPHLQLVEVAGAFAYQKVDAAAREEGPPQTSVVLSGRS